jgi:hypothetical protein
MSTPPGPLSALGLAVLIGAAPAMTETPTRAKSKAEMAALWARAEKEGRVRTARKTQPIDARGARPAEVVVTTIEGEGVETRSPPARAGDKVVRNRCPETGNEEYLVGGDAFEGRYRRTAATPAPDGWQEYVPVGGDVRFFVLGDEHGSFTFAAPWGESMVARPGDAIVQDPAKPGDMYRVARASFACTYEVSKEPER